jgi:hypothetical protein
MVSHQDPATRESRRGQPKKEKTEPFLDGNCSASQIRKGKFWQLSPSELSQDFENLVRNRIRFIVTASIRHPFKTVP